MSFSSAFKYPFNNFAKVFSIVLTLTIAFAMFMGLMLNSHDWSSVLATISDLDPAMYDIGDPQPMSGPAVLGAFGVVLVAIVSGLWLSGYSVEVVRGVMNDGGRMPEVEFARNLKDGFYLLLSSAAYWLLLILLLLVEFVLVGLTSSLGALGALVVLASVICTIGALCLMGWAYFIGMARFAAEGDHRASWQIQRNLKLSKQNWRSGASLLLYMVFLSIVYNVMRGAVDGLVGGVGGLMVGITLSIVIYYFFNLMQHFSTQHLIAQFAAEIGLRSDNYDPEKTKVDYA